MTDGDLTVSAKDLTDLATALHDMRGHLDRQVRRLNSMLETIEGGWHGPAATAYKALQRRLNDDLARIRDEIDVIAEAVTFSKGGFSGEELAVLKTFKGLGSGDAMPGQDPLGDPDSTIIQRLM